MTAQKDTTVEQLAEERASRPSRPVLRYFGGKYRIAPWIVAHLPPHRAYIELFGGAGSVLMAKPRSWSEIYNDLDAEVVNVFRVLRDDVSATRLCSMLKLTPYARDEWEQAYFPAVDPIEQARRTIVKAAMGVGSASLFKGQCGMTGSSGTGFRSGPQARTQPPVEDWNSYPRAIAQFVERLKSVVVENRDALELIHQQDAPATLFYADPPYLLSARTRPEYRHEMTDAEHEALLAALLAARGMVAISGYRSAVYDEALAGWRRYDKAVSLHQGLKRVECLWLNPAAAARERQGHLFGNGDETDFTGEGGL